MTLLMRISTHNTGVSGPIPSGAVSASIWWQIGLGLLAVGTLCLFLLGKTCGTLAVALRFASWL